MAIPLNVIGNPVAMAMGSQEDAFYRDVNGNISYIWWDGHFHVENWTTQVNAPQANGNPVTALFASDRHVFYRDVQEKISHISRYDGDRYFDNWTEYAGAPLADGDPVTMVIGAQLHIFYRDQNNEIIHIRWKDQRFSTDNWAEVENAYLVGISLTDKALVDGDLVTIVVGVQQHVFYFDPNNIANILEFINTHTVRS